MGFNLITAKPAEIEFDSETHCLGYPLAATTIVLLLGCRSILVLLI